MNRRSAERSPSGLTQHHLIRATQEAIRDLGIGGATAREITTRASANLAAIPYHFGSKDALIAEALIADARSVIDPVLELLGSDEPPEVRAASAVGLLNQQFERERARVPILLAAIARAPHSPEVAAGLSRLWSDLRSRLAEDLRVLVGEQRVPAWVAPEAMAGLIVAVVSGVVVASVVDPDGPGHQDVGNQFLMLLMAVATIGSDGS